MIEVLGVLQESPLPSRKKVRLIHTSDTHLGDQAGHPRSAKALESVVGSVAKLGGDVLLMVGDVFDNDRISDDVLEFFLAQIRRLEVPAVVLPGNHDLLDANSLYNREPFRSKPANLHIISQNGGEAITLTDLTLDLWARSINVVSDSWAHDMNAGRTHRSASLEKRVLLRIVISAVCR